jgi:hypothetical protein
VFDHKEALRALHFQREEGGLYYRSIEETNLALKSCIITYRFRQSSLSYIVKLHSYFHYNAVQCVAVPMYLTACSTAIVLKFNCRCVESEMVLPLQSSGSINLNTFDVAVYTRQKK